MPGEGLNKTKKEPSGLNEPPGMNRPVRRLDSWFHRFDSGSTYFQSNRPDRIEIVINR